MYICNLDKRSKKPTHKSPNGATKAGWISSASQCNRNRTFESGAWPLWNRHTTEHFGIEKIKNLTSCVDGNQLFLLCLERSAQQLACVLALKQLKDHCCSDWELN